MTSGPALPTTPTLTMSGPAEVRGDPTRPGGRLLLLDGVESSYVDVVDPTHLEFEYLRHTVRVIDALHPVNRPLRLFQIGGGPCALARYLIAARRDVHATIVERDPAILRLARTWMGLDPSSALSLRIDEGRDALAARGNGSLDVVMVDAFEGTIVPRHLLSTAFVEITRRALRPTGTHIVNLIDAPPLELAHAVAATMTAAYRHTALLTDLAVLQHRSPGNIVVVGSDAPIPADVLARACRRDRTPWEVRSGRSLARMVGDYPPISDGAAIDNRLTLRDPRWGTGRQG